MHGQNHIKIIYFDKFPAICLFSFSLVISSQLFVSVVHLLTVGDLSFLRHLWVLQRRLSPHFYLSCASPVFCSTTGGSLQPVEQQLSSVHWTSYKTPWLDV